MTRDLIDFIEIDVDMLTPSQYATEGIFKYDSYRCIKDWLIDNVRILLNKYNFYEHTYGHTILSKGHYENCLSSFINDIESIRKNLLNIYFKDLIEEVLVNDRIYHTSHLFKNKVTYISNAIINLSLYYTSKYTYQTIQLDILSPLYNRNNYYDSYFKNEKNRIPDWIDLPTSSFLKYLFPNVLKESNGIDYEYEVLPLLIHSIIIEYDEKYTIIVYNKNEDYNKFLIPKDYKSIDDYITEFNFFNECKILSCYRYRNEKYSFI